MLKILWNDFSLVTGILVFMEADTGNRQTHPSQTLR